MTDEPPDAVSAAPRRTVFARLAGGLVGSVTGLLSARTLAAWRGRMGLPATAGRARPARATGWSWTPIKSTMGGRSSSRTSSSRSTSRRASCSSCAHALPIALRPRPGVLPVGDAAVDRPLAAGAVIGACGVALRGQSKTLAGNAGVGAEEAAREWRQTW